MRERKSIFIAIILTLAMSVLASAQYIRTNRDFLAAAIGLTAAETKVNGVGFTSVEVPMPQVSTVLLTVMTVTFTRAAGSTSKVSFYFQVSYDDGTTWTDFVEPISGLECIEVATNHGVISGTTVRVTQAFFVPMVNRIRLSKIVNGDGANALTAVNVKLSY